MSDMPLALVTGAASGLGRCISEALSAQYHVLDFDKRIGDDVLRPDEFIDMEDDGFELDVLVNCAGVNRINWLKDVTEAEWDEVMDTNAKGIFMMTQACAPALRRAGGTVVNIVSNAAHMPMRCSAAYNASKGAALILTKQLARELAPDVTVFSVSPNKMAGTGMSNSIDEQVMRTRGWTREEAQAYQLQGLLTGEETPPQLVAEFIAFLLSSKERHRFLTGCDIPYGA